MTLTVPIAVRSAPEGLRPAPEALRRAALAVEARRLDRRHGVLKAVAARCEPGHRGLDAQGSFALRVRVLRRAVVLRRRFLRLLGELAANESDDLAWDVLRGRWRDPCSRPLGPGPPS